MKVEQVKQAIESTPKGSNIIVEWTRDCKTKKAVTDSITKSVRMVGRMGIEYENLKGVRIGRELGELPETNQGLAEWQEFEIYPYLLRHKAKGTQYLRLYKGTSRTVTHKTEWFKNGQQIAFEQVADDLLASEKKKSHGECFQVKIESIDRLHREVDFERIEAERVEAMEGVAEPV